MLDFGENVSVEIPVKVGTYGVGIFEKIAKQYEYVPGRRSTKIQFSARYPNIFSSQLEQFDTVS